MIAGAILVYLIVSDGVTRGMLRAWKIKEKQDAAKSAVASKKP